MVFISYSHKDEAYLEEAIDRLTEAGIGCWLDKHIKAGEEWKVVIDRAIQNANAVLVIVTENSYISPYVTYEWSYALGLKKLVVPVIWTHVDQSKLHDRLRDIHFIYLVDAHDREAKWQEIINVINPAQFIGELPPELKEATSNIKRNDPNIRHAGFNELENHLDSRATNILEEAVESQSPPISAEAAITLAKRTQNKNERALKGIPHALRDWDLKPEALNILSSFGNDEAVDILTTYYDEEAINSRPQDAAIIQCAHAINNPSILPLYQKIVDSASTLDVMVMIDAVVKYDDPAVLGIIKSLLRFKLEHDPCIHIIRGIAHFNNPDALLIIKTLMNKHRKTMQQNMEATIIEAAKLMGNGNGIEILKEFQICRQYATDGQILDLISIIEKSH